MKKTAVTFIMFALVFFLCAASQCVFASSITQGEYAIRLAEKLGLGEELSADSCYCRLDQG